MAEIQDLYKRFVELAASNERAREFLVYKLFNHASEQAIREAMDAWYEHVERVKHINAGHSWDSETDQYRPPAGR